MIFVFNIYPAYVDNPLAAHYVHDAGVEVGRRGEPDLIPTAW